MATIPDSDISYIEIISYGTMAAEGGGTKNVNNVYNFRRTSTVAALSKTGIESAFQTAIMIPVTNALSIRYTQSKNSVRYVDDATDPPQDVSRALPGDIAGDSAPSYETAVIQLKTGYKGKSGRGSKHFAPLADADTEGDVLTGASIVLFELVRAALMAGFTDGNGNVWKICIISKGADPPLSQLTVNPTTVFANDVVSATLNHTTGTMRRRKVRTVT